MSLEDKLSNMTIYDAKKYFRRAQNVVFNYTEMEAKVREATNNEPWGASSTLMEQISQGTYNLREREEILGMIFRRFTEKGASEWRQIYKALQLLDYLIRHGSERFIDDTRSSINLIKMLESFHFVDSQGRDQGINVRNRAKALSELLSDDEAIRSERKKARETAKKYKGVAGGSANRPAAGFNSSRAHGISVSADTDDEDESQDGGLNTSNFKDQAPNGQEANNSDDLFSFTNPGDNSTVKHQEELQDNEGDDEDDDFADFQSAAPAASVIQPAQPATNGSAPGPTGVNSLADFAYTSGPSSSSTFNIGPAISEQKKADPFSNLFTSAKSVKENTNGIQPVEKPRSSNDFVTKKEPAAVVNDDDEDDDGFGEMMAAGSSRQPQNEQSVSSSNEIDLLSF